MIFSKLLFSNKGVKAFKFRHIGMWVKGIWEIIQIGLLNDNGDIGEDNPN